MRLLAQVEDNFQPDVCWEFEVRLGRKKADPQVVEWGASRPASLARGERQANHNSTSTVVGGGSRHVTTVWGRFPFEQFFFQWG